MVNSEWGGCVMIPREDGMIRLYTQIDPKRVVNKERLMEGGQMDMGTITPEEVLAQANRIFAPFTIKFASALSWFAIWKSKLVAKISFVTVSDSLISLRACRRELFLQEPRPSCW